MSHNNAPKEIGTEGERRVADWFAANGFPFDRAPLRGSRDRGDIQGPLPYGWLIEVKARTLAAKAPAESKLPALAEARAAVKKLRRDFPYDAEKLIPLLVIQRVNYSLDRWYAVVELGDMLQAMRWRMRLRDLGEDV